MEIFTIFVSFGQTLNVKKKKKKYRVECTKISTKNYSELDYSGSVLTLQLLEEHISPDPERIPKILGGKGRVSPAAKRQELLVGRK